MIEIKCTQENLRIIPIIEVVPNPRNNNRHSIEQINYLAKLIKAHGFREPLLISNRSGFLIAGHGRLEAAKLLGMETIPAIFQDFASEAEEYQHMTADNEIARWAELDYQNVYDTLKEIPEIDTELLGIENFVLPEAVEPQCDEDEVPEVPEEPKTKLGDIYKLGNHRLMCGSSTSIDDVLKLMNGEKCDIAFTSPPYNVGKTPNGNESKYLTHNDNQSDNDFLSLLYDYTTNYLTVTDYVFSNIQSVAGNKVALIEYLYKLKEKYADTIIWDKESAEPAMARRVLNSQFEYIHVFSNDANRAIGKRDFRGTMTNVFRLNSRSGKEFAKIHKATFRVEFPEYFIKSFVESSVVDPFAGTGTTMIAAEKCGVKSYNMELDPHYVDICVARWEKFTGKKAELINGN